MAKLSHGAFKIASIENAFIAMMSARLAQILSIAIPDGKVAVGTVSSEIDPDYRFSWAVINSRETAMAKEIITEFVNGNDRCISSVGVVRMMDDMVTPVGGLIGGQKITRNDFLLAPLGEVIDATENLSFFATSTTRDFSGLQYTQIQDYKY